MRKIKPERYLIACYQPFGQWSRNIGGKEYRGLRTKQYTYVRDLNGPWLLFDNKNDKFQMNNLVNKPEYADIQKDLDKRLTDMLKNLDDNFFPEWNMLKNGDMLLMKQKQYPIGY